MARRVRARCRGRTVRLYTATVTTVHAAHAENCWAASPAGQTGHWTQGILFVGPASVLGSRN